MLCIVSRLSTRTVIRIESMPVTRAEMSNSKRVYPPSCVPTLVSLTQTSARCVAASKRSTVRRPGAAAGATTWVWSVSYTHLRAHETRHDLVCRLLLEKKKHKPRSRNQRLLSVLQPRDQGVITTRK